MQAAKPTGSPAYDAFWLRYGASGALGAYKQLTGSKHRGGRKNTLLPGGKLQPLFKNHARVSSASSRKVGSPTVLPAISPSGSASLSRETKELYRGAHTALSEKDPTSVRIYLCSTGSDFSDERQLIMTRAVPELQQYCGELGLQLQLMDLHWCQHGNTPLDRFLQVAEEEIHSCKRHSVGPTFIGLVGDKYGSICPRGQLAEQEYNQLQENSADVSIQLDELYTRPTSRHHVYRLKEKLGQETVKKYTKWIMATCNKAVNAGVMTKLDAHSFVQSALEKQIRAGILDMADARKSTLCYQREFRNITKHPESPGFCDYVDCAADEGTPVPDTDAYDAGKSLRRELADVLGSTSCKQYFIPWSDAGDQLKHQQAYKDYLQKLLDDFISDAKHLINRGFREATKMKRTATSELTKEILHHAHISERSLCNNMDGVGEDTLQHVAEFLRDPERNFKLYVLYGPSGCGKTTLMAQVKQRIPQWFHEDCVVVYRFLGSTAESSTIHSVVMSITQQICSNYGMRLPSQSKSMPTLFKALQVFRDTIETVSSSFAAVRPLYILLDGINLLHPIDESLHSLWAIRSFPNNVHMLVSTATASGDIDIVGPLAAIATSEDCCRKVDDLTDAQCKDIVDQFCDQFNLTVSDHEVKLIMDAVYNTKTFLHLNLLCKQLQYCSYDDSTTVAEQNLDRSGRETFKRIITVLEEKYGPLLVKYVLSYLTLSPVGIGEGLLVDLITSDYPVMLEQDFFHNVPPEKTLLLSPAVWADLKHEMLPYIEEGHAYRQSLLKWKHYEYCMAVSEKYGVIFPGIQEDKVTLDGTEFTLSLHESISKFYLDSYASDDTKDHNTLVTPQLTNKWNLAKLMKLPLHVNVLLPIEGVENIKKNIHFNLHWILTKMEVESPRAVLQDTYTAAQLVSHFTNEGVIEGESDGPSDLDLMYEFWQLALPALQEGAAIKLELLARMGTLADHHPYIDRLLKEIKSDIESSTSPTFCPSFPCSKAPGSVNKHTIRGPTALIDCILSGKVAVLFSQQKGVELWRVDTAELLHRFDVNKEQATSGIIINSTGDIVLICHYSHLTHTMDVGVWSTHTGIEVIHSTFTNQFEAVALDPEDKLLVVSTVLGEDPAAETTSRFLLGVDIRTRDIIHKIPVDSSALHTDGVAAMYFLDKLVKDELCLLTMGTKVAKDAAIWNIDKETVLFQLDLQVYAELVHIAHDRNVAVCGSPASGTVLRVDLAAGNISHTIPQPALADMYVSKSAKHLVTTSRKGNVIITSMEDQKEVKTFAIQGLAKDEVVKMVADPYEEFLFFGTKCGAVFIYKLASGSRVFTLEEHQSKINNLFCWNQTQLISVSIDGLTKIWNISAILKSASTDDERKRNDGVMQFTQPITDEDHTPTTDASTTSVCYPSHYEDIAGVLHVPTGVLTYSHTNPIKIWNPETGVFVKSWESTARLQIREAYLAYKGRLLVGHVAMPDRTDATCLQVWNVEDGSLVPFADKSTEGLTVYCSHLLPMEDKVFLVAPSIKKQRKGISLGVLDLFEMRVLSSVHCNITGGMDASNMHVVGCSTELPKQPETDQQDDERLQQEETGAQEAEEPPSNTRPPTGAAGEEDDAPAAPEQLNTYVLLGYYPEPDSSYFFCFTLEGHRLMMDSTLPLHYDTHSEQCAGALDDGRAVCGTVDGSLIIIDMQTQAIDQHLVDGGLVTAIAQGYVRSQSVSGKPAHEGMVTSLKAIVSAGWLVTGGVDSKVKVWDYQKATLLQVLSAHTEQIECMDVSNGCKILVSGGADKRLVAWQIEDGQKLSVFYADEQIRSVHISPDVKTVAATYGSSKPKLALLRLFNMQ